MTRKTVSLRTLLYASIALLFTSGLAQAQCKPPANQKPPLSPAEKATVTLSNKPLVIYYCAPSLKGRTIGDQIVPYEQVWRTGANTATTLVTQSKLRIGKDLIVDPGTYTIYTIPSRSGWTLIVNKQTGQWGTVYNKDQDLGRVKMSEDVVSGASVEKFTIDFEHTQHLSTELHLRWGMVNVFVPITAIT